MSVLTFYVPKGWDGGVQLMYAYLTYAVLGLIYFMVNVPYGSLATASITAKQGHCPPDNAPTNCRPSS